MECSAMAVNRGAMAGRSNPAATLGIFSSSSLRWLATNSVYHDRSHLYYTGALKAYCGKKSKLQKQMLKGLFALHDGSLSEKRVTKLLELVSMDLVAAALIFVNDKCYRSYATSKFIGKLDNTTKLYRINGENATNPAAFSSAVKKLFSNLSARVDESPIRYASGFTSQYSQITNIYGLIQCRRDIFGEDCTACIARKSDLGFVQTHLY